MIYKQHLGNIERSSRFQRGRSGSLYNLIAPVFIATKSTQPMLVFTKVFCEITFKKLLEMLQNFLEAVPVRFLLFLLSTREFGKSRLVAELQCWSASHHDSSANPECIMTFWGCPFAKKAALLLSGLVNFILQGSMIPFLERAKKNDLLDVS
mmetsp:Transcript_28599/g.51712  ORF Transcript_28599/g.51712 Transcript_28599/m.51712 type:complete len:152 (-) Transcript_28599:826-1281(-)